MRWGLHSVLSAGVAAGAAFAQSDAPLIGGGEMAGCVAIVGVWSWHFGGRVTFEPNGAALWRVSPDAGTGRRASWHCNPSAGTTEIAWEQGIVDSVTLSEDGNSLAGQNQHGVAVSAIRFDAEAERRTEEAAARTVVDPQLVGTWQLEILLPTPQGPVAVVWAIGADGRYAIDAGSFSHAGRMRARGGQWELAAETNGFSDGGSYQFQSWATIVTQARSGVGRWHRREPRLRLETVAMNQEQVPAALPDLVLAADRLARSWQKDAVLVDLKLDFADQQKRRPEIELSYVAPAGGGGLVVTVAPEGTRFFEHTAVNWGERAIPGGFLDLPEAWATARQHGLPPPLGRAGLRIWQPPGQDPVLAWSLTSQRSGAPGVNLDGIAGQLLHGDLTGYVAEYNRMWQEAAEGLRRLFAQPAPPASSSSYDFDWGPGGSSSDSGGSGRSSSDSWARDTALQNAWSAGDMDAYNRIQSGQSTWSDSSRYGY